LKSGYLLENRLESILDKHGYFVDANNVYEDPITTKSRELDLYALGAQRVWKEHQFVFPCLLVECINNPQPIAFITKEPQTPFLHHNYFKISGIPVKILEEDEEDSWISITDYLNMDKYHHYCTGRVATQYCSFKKKKGSSNWMAFHEERHFDCIKKLCDAVNYNRDKHFEGWVFDEDEDLNLQMYYPIVVLQGGLFDARPSKTGVHIYSTEHIIFKQNAIVNGEECTYLIDVIKESFFEKFLAFVDDEIAKTVRRIQRRKPQIRRSIDEIASRGKKARNDKEVKGIMEF